MWNHQCGLDSSKMSAGKRWIPKIDDHKKKYTSWKKSHWSGGMIDLWYLEWQKQEKHRAFSYSQVLSLLDFGFYIQTVWD